MFLTANAIVQEFGVDHTIAKFFVDREPPKDNLYWKDKLLYLRPQPGYIFLPLIVDLFYKSGVELSELLSEKFVTILEQIGNYAAAQEYNRITNHEAIKLCSKLVENNCSDHFLHEVSSHLNGEESKLSILSTPFKALHRGDMFLFSLCMLTCNEEQKFELVKTWFALISTLLLLDDSEDYDSDFARGEENAFIESGSNQEGFNKIKALLSQNLDHIKKLNVTMADGLHKKFIALADKPVIKKYLN